MEINRENALVCFSRLLRAGYLESYRMLIISTDQKVTTGTTDEQTSLSSWETMFCALSWYDIDEEIEEDCLRSSCAVIVVEYCVVGWWSGKSEWLSTFRWMAAECPAELTWLERLSFWKLAQTTLSGPGRVVYRPGWNQPLAAGLGLKTSPSNITHPSIHHLREIGSGLAIYSGG
jgi:hypothetical protein